MFAHSYEWYGFQDKYDLVLHERVSKFCIYINCFEFYKEVKISICALFVSKTQYLFSRHMNIIVNNILLNI